MTRSNIANLAVLLLGTSLGATAALADELECQSVNSDPAASPWSQAKFHNVIKGSRYLQIDNDGGSANVPSCVSSDDMQRGFYDPDNWYLTGRNMFFGIAGGKRAYRVELRGTNFVGTVTRKFASKIKVQRSGSSSQGYTVAQVFSETERKPILRIEMIGSRKDGDKTLSNHLWAIYRTGTGENQSVYKPLAAASTSFEALDIIYNDGGKISVTYGSSVVTFDENFALWNRADNNVYMKAGCYLQRDGDCGVTYSSLRFE